MPRIMLTLSIKAYRLDISNYCPESPKMILVTSVFELPHAIFGNVRLIVRKNRKFVQIHSNLVKKN